MPLVSLAFAGTATTAVAIRSVLWLLVIQITADLVIRCVRAAVRSMSMPDRWGLIRSSAVMATAVFAAADVLAAAIRGLSRSSAALLGAAAGAVTLLLALVVRIPVRCKRNRRGERVVRIKPPRPRAYNARLSRTLVVWQIAMSLATLVPLRFGGLLVGAPGVSRLVGTVTVGQFRPLAEVRPIEAGQCLFEPVVRTRNRVVPCSTPHKAEVVAKVAADEPCPRADDFDTLLRIRVDRTVPVDGTAYCVVRGADPRLHWRDRVPRRNELPETL